MKNYLILFTLVSITFSQQYEDEIILKNRRVINGIIIEQKPNKYIKIKSGEHIYVFKMDEIDIIKKELITEMNVGKYDPYTGEKYKSKTYAEEKIRKNNLEHIKNNHSIGIGISNNKSCNIIQYTYDLKLTKNTAVFCLLGFGNFYGLGLTWQSNYNENGFMIGLSGGADVGSSPFISSAISYQWRLGNSSFYLSLGLLQYYYQKTYYYYHNGKSDSKMEKVIFPIISYDYRF
ncbi:MAG: hypothetical protein CMF96_01810 [Candidatus Marinimicrobia bacterium]|nr:hypothetical protein [Candidatus Neomarinimicrobiota bacterium]|tara:strand:+ start:503 stop:1201 length:699 start_codon:yes stop_codon:yes gene_type:complete